MKVHYLEIVSENVDAVCASYEAAHGIKFGEPDPLLGEARTVVLADGTTVGVRGAMSDQEQPVVRPYWLVDDIDAALSAVTNCGAEVMHPPLEISGRGKFAIYSQGNIQHGLWQL